MASAAFRLSLSVSLCLTLSLSLFLSLSLSLSLISDKMLGMGKREERWWGWKGK
jgi:hypothetical protein